jgi:putative holliday junction resolvase
MPEQAAIANRPARTVLAFDFGLKRIGVAVGEPELGTAHPLPAVTSFEKIQSLIAEWQPAALVVGLPTSVQGVAHKMTRQAEDFARRLEKRFKLPVARVDERYTSVEAASRLKGVKNKAVDSVAAQLILEQYFDQTA